MLNKRVHVLFDQREHSLLGMIAGIRGLSVGELVRRAVAERYLSGKEHELELRKMVFENLKNWQKEIGISKQPTDYKKLVSYGRKW